MGDEDPHLLSLADALTCAFGASIALFLIFVVLVRFEPPAPVPTSGTQAASSIVASLANEEPGVSSLVIVASSKLPTTNCNNSANETIDIQGTNRTTTRSWSSERTLWKGKDQIGVLCTKVFEIPEGITPNSQPALVATRGNNNESIAFRVHVGANVWPSWRGFHTEYLGAFVPPKGKKILQVTGETDAPVLTSKDF